MTALAGSRIAQPQQLTGARVRAMNLLRTEVNFIPNSEFRSLNTGDSDFIGSTLEQSDGSKTAPTELPAHLLRMCEAELLTQERETALFREMNYLKYRANALRSRIDPDRVDTEMIITIETLLSRARAIRDHIIQANMRLVISVVKKFVTPRQSFDETFSDGILTLMKAVEKFDYDRGFRFSTYAYRSIVRHAYRTVTTARIEDARFLSGGEDWVLEQEAEHSPSTMTDQVWSNLRELTTAMLQRLDRRERFIIRSRYALGSHRKTRTLQYLADRLGVSKERVRQLEQRAVGKLRTMAADFEAEEPFGAAVASCWHKIL